MPEVGEAWVTLSADLSQLQTNMQQAESTVTLTTGNMQVAAGGVVTSFGTLIPATTAVSGGTSELARSTSLSARNMLMLASAAGLGGSEFRVLNQALRGAYVASTVATGSFKGLALAIKSFFIELGPVGWAIIALGVSIATGLSIWSKHKKAVEDAKKAMSEYTSNVKEQTRSHWDLHDVLVQELLVAQGMDELAAMHEVNTKAINRSKEAEKEYLKGLEDYQKFLKTTPFRGKTQAELRAEQAEFDRLEGSYAAKLKDTEMIRVAEIEAIRKRGYEKELNDFQAQVKDLESASVRAQSGIVDIAKDTAMKMMKAAGYQELARVLQIRIDADDALKSLNEYAASIEAAGNMTDELRERLKDLAGQIIDTRDAEIRASREIGGAHGVALGQTELMARRAGQIAVNASATFPAAEMKNTATENTALKTYSVLVDIYNLWAKNSQTGGVYAR